MEIQDIIRRKEREIERESESEEKRDETKGMWKHL
jgi:hypothetical protein